MFREELLYIGRSFGKLVNVQLSLFLKPGDDDSSISRRDSSSAASAASAAEDEAAGGTGLEERKVEEAENDLSSMDEDEDLEKVTYPKCVFFILAMEACERFSFYGMRGEKEREREKKRRSVKGFVN